jgi:hypothetical protein
MEARGAFRLILLYSFISYSFSFFSIFKSNFEFKLCGSPLQIIYVKLAVLIMEIFILYYLHFHDLYFLLLPFFLIFKL